MAVVGRQEIKIVVARHVEPGNPDAPEDAVVARKERQVVIEDIAFGDRQVVATVGPALDDLQPARKRNPGDTRLARIARAVAVQILEDEARDNFARGGILRLLGGLVRLRAPFWPRPVGPGSRRR